MERANSIKHLWLTLEFLGDLASVLSSHLQQSCLFIYHHLRPGADGSLGLSLGDNSTHMQSWPRQDLWNRIMSSYQCSNKTQAEAQSPDVLLCGFIDSSYTEVISSQEVDYFHYSKGWKSRTQCIKIKLKQSKPFPVSNYRIKGESVIAAKQKFPN